MRRERAGFEGKSGVSIYPMLLKASLTVAVLAAPGGARAEVDVPDCPSVSEERFAELRDHQTISLKRSVPKNDPVKWNGVILVDVKTLAPVEEFGLSVAGGSFHSELGAVHLEAQFRAWEYTYDPGSPGKNPNSPGAIIGYGPCLTDGELIISQNEIKNSSAQYIMPNVFVCEEISNQFLLVRLIPGKGHKFCFSLTRSGDISPPSVWIGTRVQAGKQWYRKTADGWQVE